MRRLLVVALGAALAGCGATVVPPFTPEPAPSVDPGVSEEAADVAAAFLARMSDPAVTYRVLGTMAIGQENADGMPPARVVSRYDVAGDAYAGWVQIRGTALDQTRVGDYQVLVRDGSTHFYGGSAIDVTSAATPAAARQANPYAEMSTDDLVFMGMSGELFDFAVRPWLGGDPIGEWIDVGILPSGGPAPMTMESHLTHLTIDSSGIPHRLTSHWTFVAGSDEVPGQGSIFDDYSAFGLYVNIAEANPDHLMFGSTSFDLVGEDAPWFEIRPADGPTAELSITFEEPEEPMMLGIEGAIGFLRAEDPDGQPVLDTMIALEGDTLTIPVGAQRLVVYYRPCDGNCGLLDHPHEFCSVGLDVQHGARYELTVAPVSARHTDCILTPSP